MELEQLKAKFASSGNESAVLACIFKDPAHYYNVEQKLGEEDFLTPHHRAIYTIVRSLMRQEVITIDSAAILTQAASLNLEKNIGGFDYVNALFDKSIDPKNIDFYIARVADAAMKIRIMLASDEIIEITDKNKTLTDSTLPAKDLVDYAQEKFLQIAMDGQRGTDAVNMSEGLNDLIAEAMDNSDRIKGIATGYDRLDQAINGLEPGTLTVLGARPKVGKSTMLMNWAKHMAYHQNLPVLYIDTEMSLREQQFRLTSMLSQVPEREIKNGLFKEFNDQLSQVDTARDIINRGSLFHKYYPDFTAEGVGSLVRKFHYQYGIACVIFDYIKLPDADLQNSSNVKEHQALGYLCVALKNLAGQLQIPIVTAAQIGRPGANKGRVTSAEFADSDRILRYANTLLGLAHKTRDEMQEAEEHFGRDNARSMGTHRLQILDTRAGGFDFGGIDIHFRQEVLTMREADVQSRDLMNVSEEDNTNGF